MIIAPLHPLMLPLAVAIWSIDALTWIVLVRLAVGRASSQRLRSVAWGLAPLTDPARRAMRRALNRTGFCPAWAAWIALVLVMLAGRQLLLWLAVSTF